ncbi:MAG: ABC-type transport auxiliary lipoprotein family protein [Alphaproteobacteria bacterium]|nr:ABC-type transport auxiliary lipoprotein family protein [Alphaproteobacteria bacterium]
MDMTKRRLLNFAAALPALLAIPGCQLVGSGPPPREFRLTPKSSFSDQLQKVDWSLGVSLPRADRSIDTDRIVRLTGGIELEPYANVAWANRPTPMIQTLILQSFQNSGAIDLVVDDRSDIRPDMVLRTALREFQAEHVDAGPPEIRVALDARLLEMPKRKVLDSEIFDRTVVAVGNNIEAIIAAFDQALGKALKALVEWTLTTGEGAR